MLIDTDVVIWALRGNRRAAVALDNAVDPKISIVTRIELAQGARNKRELATIRATLQSWTAQTVSLNEEIATRALIYVERFSLAHGMRLADALIAASAVTSGAELLTANVKHYAFVEGLEVRRFSPG